MVDRRRFDSTGSGGSSQDQERQTVRASGHRKAELRFRWGDAVEVGREARTERRVGSKSRLRQEQLASALALVTSALRSGLTAAP